MSAADPSVVLITTAHREGSAGPSQDRVFVGTSSVVVLDGASQPEPSQHDGGWLADQLGIELIRRLEAVPGLDLGQALKGSIEAVAEQFDLSPGQAPSTTVSIVRCSDVDVDVLVLGDSPVVARRLDGGVVIVRDDRLSRVTGRDQFEAALSGGGFADEHTDAWGSLIERQRAVRNAAAGYWIAEAVPEAADHAIRASWPAADLDCLLIVTDGVADGVDVYGVPQDWTTALSIAADNPQALVDTIHAVEESDPHGIKWPRAKLHDDKAIAVITFAAIAE